MLAGDREGLLSLMEGQLRKDTLDAIREQLNAATENMSVSSEGERMEWRKRRSAEASWNAAQASKARDGSVEAQGASAASTMRWCGGGMEAAALAAATAVVGSSTIEQLLDIVVTAASAETDSCCHQLHCPHWGSICQAAQNAIQIVGVDLEEAFGDADKVHASIEGVIVQVVT